MCHEIRQKRRIFKKKHALKITITFSISISFQSPFNLFYQVHRMGLLHQLPPIAYLLGSFLPGNQSGIIRPSKRPGGEPQRGLRTRVQDGGAGDGKDASRWMEGGLTATKRKRKQHPSQQPEQSAIGQR